MVKTIFINAVLAFILFAPLSVSSELHVGLGKTNITPLIGTPSAGYAERKGEGMEGVHDPLQSKVLFDDKGLINSEGQL